MSETQDPAEALERQTEADNMWARTVDLTVASRPKRMKQLPAYQSLADILRDQPDIGPVEASKLVGLKKEKTRQIISALKDTFAKLTLEEKI